MRECWLRPNRRAILAGLVVPALLLIVGLGLALGFRDSGSPGALAWTGWGFVVIAIVVAVLLLYLTRLPRLAYGNGQLFVYLGTPQPLLVPVDLVECFFLGHGPSMMPATGGKETESSTIVVRLAESAQEWRHRDVKPALGHWCDGYIVIRGTWCEPITAQLVQKLNSRLVEAHRQVRRSRELETA